MAPFEVCSHLTVAIDVVPYGVPVAVELLETLDVTFFMQ